MRFTIFLAVILLSLSGTTVAGQGTPSSSTDDFISMHWEAASTSESVLWYELSGSSERVAVEPEAVLGTRHFVTARVTGNQSSGNLTVEVEMTAEGQRRIRELSSANIGRRLAIVLDGDVMAIPKVMSAVGGTAFPLGPMLDAGTAEELARSINAAIQRI